MNHLFHHSNIFVLPEAEKQQLTLIGENKKAVLIIIRVEELNPELMVFLGKILEAVRLNIKEDIHILNITNHSSISFPQLYHKHAYQYLLCFGLQPKEMGLNIECQLYRSFTLSEVTMLFANNLQDIFNERQQGKKQMAVALWKALQGIFLK